TAAWAGQNGRATSARANREIGFMAISLGWAGGYTLWETGGARACRKEGVGPVPPIGTSGQLLRVRRTVSGCARNAHVSTIHCAFCAPAAIASHSLATLFRGSMEPTTP